MMRRREFLRRSAGALGAVLGEARRGAAPTRRPTADVVVLLPGIMGSVLRKGDRDVWARSGGAIVSGPRALGGRVRELTLAGDPPDVDDLGDGITAVRLFPDTHMLPGLWKIDGYSKISQTIQAELDVTPGRNFFEFPYDW